MHSRRSATANKNCSSTGFRDFNPCTPDGVQLDSPATGWGTVAISIHALQTECNPDTGKPAFTNVISIHALQTECNPRRQVHNVTVGPISIHALQTECNLLQQLIKLLLCNFNPCTPDGVQLRQLRNALGVINISIHALQTECNDRAGQG